MVAQLVYATGNVSHYYANTSKYIFVYNFLKQNVFHDMFPDSLLKEYAKLSVRLCFVESSPDILEFGNNMVSTCIDVYNTITTQLLPTPSKSHYTFNLRDLSKLFQGILMTNASHLVVS